MLEYQIIKRMYPFAEYVKYLAGDDLTEEQIVSLFKGEKIKCTVHFAYPSKKRLAKADVYGGHPAGGLKLCDTTIWVNKARTDLYYEYWDYDGESLKKILPPEEDPEEIERRKNIRIAIIFLIAAIISAACIWLSFKK